MLLYHSWLVFFVQYFSFLIDQKIDHQCRYRLVSDICRDMPNRILGRIKLASADTANYIIKVCNRGYVLSRGWLLHVVILFYITFSFSFFCYPLGHQVYYFSTTLHPSKTPYHHSRPFLSMYKVCDRLRPKTDPKFYIRI